MNPPHLFPLGKIVATAHALHSLTHEEMVVALSRHQSGDWGDLDDSDISANTASLSQGGRILSAYTTTNRLRFWIITEADRSLTTVLLTQDY
jgi:hypothetical protein